VDVGILSEEVAQLFNKLFAWRLAKIRIRRAHVLRGVTKSEEFRAFQGCIFVGVISDVASDILRDRFLAVYRTCWESA
jgi:hypothetical protein